ncbi:MAG: hypothetical protein QM831_32895 [Kofleriaceae bacterium]
MPANLEIQSLDLETLNAVTGGAGTKADWASIRQQAAQYCPVTAKKYANVDPSTVTRKQAQAMGNSCVAEISPLFRGIAKGRIDDAINQAFPAK